MPDSDTVHVVLTVKFSKDIQNRFEEISPRIKLHVHPARQGSDVPNRLWKNAEVLYTTNVLPPPGTETKLRWVQSHFAGVDSLLTHPFVKEHSDLVLTSTSGIHATNMGEYVLGMMLALGHHLPEMLEDQRSQNWSEERFERFMPVELRRSTVGILGYGSIGREVARLCKALGATVLATKKDLKMLDDEGYRVEGTGDPEGDLFDRLYPPEATAYMVKDCDFVVITLPLTSSTKGSFDEDIIAAMKPGSFLINVGRGGIVDEDALLEALESRKIAGAAMDVFATEPLPANHPLWKAPNFILTPHISGNTPDYNEKAAAVFEDNLRRYLEGRPLKNVISREMEY
jgi:phosphoglycerate dehydrogenase-like enzyme